MFEYVINEVCQASQVDFEEGGVDQQTLKELQKVSIPRCFPPDYLVLLHFSSDQNTSLSLEEIEELFVFKY